MKLYRTTLICIALLLSALGYSQKATVAAMNYDISDNLDLQAVASIFGDSRDLADFERRLNDPQSQISNLDLNRDNYVDYLRVIEVTEGQTHLIVIQAVLGQDMFQDVATIEVEKDRKNRVQVQIVGNEYLYGRNYIYEPVYVSTPILFDVFWGVSYRPYYSSWYWNYYPTYYSPWEPYPIYRYRNNIHVHINTSNRYVYASDRRSSRSVRLLNDVRGNSYERQNPQNSFSSRNANTSNRYVLDQNRNSSRSVQSQNGNSVSSGRGNDGSNSGRQVNSSTRESYNTTSARPVSSSRDVNSSSSRSTNTMSTRVAPSTTSNSSRSSSSRSSMRSSSAATSQPARIERATSSSRSSSNFNSNSGSSSRSSSSMSSGRSSSSSSMGASSSSRGSGGGSSSRSGSSSR
ncbi:hypothetical protein [Flavobacterium sp. HSC-61S13]|uniref:hypothetical protein n=1 Tax=Flavobacterium sp. HSC-61S13 TaxID=2910963 RepID=UPI0020A10368|nr:hypothetical protein [Flavobacterium sp. HSC-61S13]MCP1995098.1 hypothetical protein [Flavobacterium sp. HSC-61S13]